MTARPHATSPRPTNRFQRYSDDYTHTLIVYGRVCNRGMVMDLIPKNRARRQTVTTGAHLPIQANLPQFKAANRDRFREDRVETTRHHRSICFPTVGCRGPGAAD